MYDLVYFGNDFDDSIDAIRNQSDFISEISEKFGNVKLTDAYDYIKGLRQSVELTEEQKEDYYSWLIAFGWLDFSLSLQMIMMENEVEFKRLVEISKKQYPENFES